MPPDATLGAPWKTPLGVDNVTVPVVALKKCAPAPRNIIGFGTVTVYGAVPVNLVTILSLGAVRVTAPVAVVTRFVVLYRAMFFRPIMLLKFQCRIRLQIHPKHCY